MKTFFVAYVTCLIVQKMLCVCVCCFSCFPLLKLTKKCTTGGEFSSLRPALWRWLWHAKHHPLPCSVVDPRKPMKSKDNEDQVGKETSIPKKVVFFVRGKDFLGGHPTFIF